MTETTLRKRARTYLAMNAAESGADVLIDELSTTIERQQQVIDLLMKAVEPFAETASPINAQDTSAFRGFFSVGDLRRAREAKVEAERILNHSHPGLEREE